MGDDQRSISRWEAVQIIVLLLGVAGALANLAGLWQAPGQSEARMARAEARKENEYWTESMKRRTDETKRRDAREKERRRDFEETMKRAFDP
ncbi:MAG: hypothetical protein HYS63_09410 [Methylocystis sp.]|nr:hypothetical protein [Methylocystis sp.]